MKITRSIVCVLMFLVVSDGVLSQSSVLSSGSWFKVSVEEEGIYKISYDLLRKMGVDAGKIDPAKIRMYGNPGGMLPQANETPRPADLSEIAIHVNGGEDGKFDRKDFILFYGQGPYDATYDIGKQIFRYGNNLYSDENFYFLTISDQPGRRVTAADAVPSSSNVISTYSDFIYHELDEHNELHSGREWYGEKFGLTTDHSFSFKKEGIIPGSAIKLVSDVMGQSYAPVAFKVYVNESKVAEQNIFPIPTGSYSIKGIDKRDTVVLAESITGASQQNEFRIQYQFAKASGYSQGYLDFFLLNFERSLRQYGKQTIFTSPSSVSQPVSTFVIENVSGNSVVWDITDPSAIKTHPVEFSGSQLTFSAETPILKKFAVFTSDVEAPKPVGRIPNQDLHALTTPELIIVTNEEFLNEAQRLAAHRQNHNNWAVHVVTTQQVFNEFSSGRQDVTAIRDFVKHLYDKNPVTLKALLLFGRGSYDYKDRVNDNTNFVPTYESRNSLDPIKTYFSDDYFGFLELNEGEWPESPAKNHTLDIGVGRLPVTSPEQAATVVDKIIQYETDLNAAGYWRKKIVFVADDGNSVDGFDPQHQSQADQLAVYIEENQPAFDTKKIFMGTYPKELRPNGETSPKMTEDIVRAFEDGSLIINYTGHGSEQIWADESVFSPRTIADLRNKIYPFLVTATCEFGRQDDPLISSAELTLMKKDAGSIGLVSTSRPVYANTNFDLNSAFYEALFERGPSGYLPIGEVFRNTKNNSSTGVSNRNFSLIADPSMTLAMPPDMIRVNSVKTSNGSDTLKALSTVLISGQVENFQGELLADFDGEVEVLLFDKEVTLETTGRNDPAFQFKEWNNILFRGRATVDDGLFSVDFILPKNMAYSVAQGKVSLYARGHDGRDAKGHYDNFKVGGTEDAVLADVTSPQISLFMGDTTFINGGVTSPDTYIVAKFTDASGINVSGYGLGNTIFASLDDGAETWFLNNYYVADRDDYSRGSIRYPVYGLLPGKHTLTLQAWDVHNNPATASIDFIVTGDQLVIETMGNYPNPFSDKTTLFFTHNRSGDDLEAQLFIYSSAGNLIEALQIPISQSEYRIELMEFDAGRNEKKLAAGLYLARLVVRSLSNGSKNELVTKLIILN